MTPRAMAAALQRSGPVLRAHGVEVELEDRTHSGRQWTLTKRNGDGDDGEDGDEGGGEDGEDGDEGAEEKEVGDATVTTVTPSRRGSDQGEQGDEGVTVPVTFPDPDRHGEDPDRDRHGSDTQPSRPDPLRHKGGDGRDGRDGSLPTSFSSDDGPDYEEFD